ncbi:MAG: DEAD/DEAH box helicase [Gammaproteobacteria bacterium]|nr:DEAD/DEAH box helicase [Gammaproteobacteria bacterium]
MSYIAHTPPKDNPHLAPHLYADHINEALKYGLALLDYVLSFSNSGATERDAFRKALTIAIMLHDLGKLDEGNQKVFRGDIHGRLPVDHIEAGVAIAAEMENELIGWLIRGHHAPGLPSKKAEKYFIKQLVRETGCQLSATCLRGLRHRRTKEEATTKDDYGKHFCAIQETDKKLDSYKERQRSVCGQWPEIPMPLPDSGLATRLMLSCLVEADHLSAASYSKGESMPDFHSANTQWEKRLVALDCYVTGLAKKGDDPGSARNKLRAEFYQRCYSGNLLDSRLVACSAPVGLGKTTSVMVYLLRKAIQDGSSRIFVIAPFSNIIDQTVKVLRKALILEHESPAEIIAAHHHKAEFSNKNMRQYAASWHAPVVVTTAVQFFETLASANPSKLRKLHAVVGASIFIDESHACLPPELLSVSWHWLKKLSEDWGCNVVFSSGSMVEYWNDSYLIGDETMHIPDLLSERLRLKAQKQESHRLEYRKVENSFNLVELVEFLKSEETWSEINEECKPSCLVILNTVQSAAVVADALAEELGDKSRVLCDKAVLHLSTSLAPKDRDNMLKEVTRRQGETEWDTKHWYLIATSCVEAGVDLDFAVGYREQCSVTSFLQVAGRINRHDVRNIAVLKNFTIKPEDGLSHHPGFKESSIVFDDLWAEIIDPKNTINSLCTRAIRKEFSRFPEKKELSEELLKNESSCNFQQINDDYRVIKSNTITVVVDADIVKKLESGVPVNWQHIQENSVQLWVNKVNKLGLNAIQGCSQDNIYSWIDIYEYDPHFLGIMAGLIKPNKFFEETGGVL